MQPDLNYNHLNEQQLTMLRLLKNPFPEKYFQQLKQVAVDLLVQQIDDAMHDRKTGYGKLRKRRERATSEKN